MFTVEFNDTEVDRAFARLSASLADTEPLMQDLGDMLVQSTQDRMGRGEQPDGQPFAPRSQTTLDRYAKLGLSYGPPLHQSGVMRGQIAYDAGNGYLILSSNQVQSAVMQFGAKKGAFGNNAAGRPIPWGDIPARPFLGVSDDDSDNIRAAVTEWLAESVGGGQTPGD